MKAFPDIRASRPIRRAFWLAQFIPCIQFFAHETHIGFYRSASAREWNPTMSRPFIKKNRYGWSLCK